MLLQEVERVAILLGLLEYRAEPKVGVLPADDALANGLVRLALETEKLAVLAVPLLQVRPELIEQSVAECMLGGRLTRRELVFALDLGKGTHSAPDANRPSKSASRTWSHPQFELTMLFCRIFRPRHLFYKMSLRPSIKDCATNRSKFERIILETDWMTNLRLRIGDSIRGSTGRSAAICRGDRSVA